MPYIHQSAPKSSAKTTCANGYGSLTYTCLTSSRPVSWAQTARTFWSLLHLMEKYSSADACKPCSIAGWIFRNSHSTIKLVRWISKVVSTKPFLFEREITLNYFQSCHGHSIYFREIQCIKFAYHVGERQSSASVFRIASHGIFVDWFLDQRVGGARRHRQHAARGR